MRRYATVWAAAYLAFGVMAVLAGRPVFALAGHRAPTAWNWLAVVAGVAALVALFVPARRTLLALAVVTGAFAFGLLMDAVTVLFEQRVDDGVGATHRLLAAGGTALLVAAARGDRTPDRPAPDRPVRGAAPVVGVAPPRIRRVALAGALAVVPYVAMKLTWALGGTFAGRSGEEMRALAERNGAGTLWLTLESWGLDPTVLLAVAGAALVLTLAHPVAAVLPRWLLLAPSLLGAATLAPYGVVGVGYLALATAGVVTIPAGDFPTGADALLVSWIGLGAFAGYGVALAVVAYDFWRRTTGRPAARARRRRPRPEPVPAADVAPPSRAIRVAAMLVPLCVLPSAVWRFVEVTIGGAPEECPANFMGRWEPVYVAGLSFGSVAAALLTLGLVRPWGVVFRGRTVPARPVVLAGAAGAALLWLLYTWGVVNNAFDLYQPSAGTACTDPFSGPGSAVAIAAYAPLVLWAPLLTVVVADYRRRRMGREPSALR
jgi:hypothetical protein